MRRALQGAIDDDEAKVVGGDPRRGGPLGRLYAGHPEHVIRRHDAAIGQRYLAGFGRRHLGAGHHVHPPTTQALHRPAAQAGRKAGQNPRPGFDQRAVDARLRPADGQGEFDAPGAAADNGQTANPLLGAKPLPRRQEAADGLHRRDEVGSDACPRHASRIDREHVVAQRRAVVERDALVLGVQPGGFGGDEAGAGKRREPRQVDVDVVPGVVAGHQAGQHSAVGRVRFSCDDGEAKPGFAGHPERLEHLHMGMAAAEQHDVAQRRRMRRPVHRWAGLASCPWRQHAAIRHGETGS